MEPKKGFIRVLAGELADKEIEILYFPPEYSLEKSNSFTAIDIPGLESPFLQYVKGNSSSLSLEVFYDTYEDGKDVRTLTDQLYNLMNIDPQLHAPPPLQFIWGMASAEPFNCVLESVTRKFTMFLADGRPVRARLTIRLKEYKLELNKREKAVQSPDKTKFYVTIEGDSLWAISHREYGSPFLWRHIADKNDLYDPRFLAPGTELIIPALE